MSEYQVTEYKTDKAIVIIRKPILTDEERKAREEKLKKALVKYEKERMKKNGLYGCA